MEITKQQRGETLELKVRGRVDSYWADHLGSAVDQEIRQGFHNIQLDLSEVAYVSSAGIGTLVRLYKDLKAIQGSFVISSCSPIVLKILQLSKLEDLLVAKAPSAATAPAIAAVQSPAAPEKIDRPEGTYEVYALGSDATLDCKTLGDPAPLDSAAFDQNHCRTFHFSGSSLAIGLGALGENFEDCKNRFGEFISAGGALAYLPTDGTNVPDFLLANDASSAEVQVCYGITCQNVNKRPFSKLLRFESKGGVPLTFTALVESCLELSGSKQVGLVMIAETAGLIGAALRRSPVTRSDGAFEFPEIRNWLGFNAEPTYSNRVVLIAGIAVRENSDHLASFLRPFPKGSDTAFSGHFHAAAFSYRPVQRGKIDMNASIKTLFENQTLEGILHLLTDDRPSSGSGETELFRGACWVSPINTSTEARS